MQRRRATTISEVAARAGVSVATASKALNGKDQVRAETRARVQQVAEELGFQPNALAQGLLSGRTRTVGLLCGGVDRFSLPVLLGAEDAFGAGEMSVLLCDGRGDAIREQHYIRMLLARRVDGLIVVGESTDPHPSITDGLPVPVVYAYAPSTDPGDVSYVPDDVGGAGLAVRHLVTLGRRRIAHVTGPVDYLAARDRATGLEAALTEAGLALAGDEVLYGAWSQRWGRQAAELLLSTAPDIDAVFCGSDQIAYGFIEAAHQMGRRVPEDIAVVGYDNWDVFATEARPPLTTVDVNLDLLGRAAAQHLLTNDDPPAAADPDAAGPGIHRMPCRLVVRDSTAPSPS
jgi:LacI family transcriptional regulator, galactose operon repressor